MSLLFPEMAPPRPVIPALPPGFQYHRDFLSVAEEQALLDGIAGLELRNSQYHEYTARRRTAGFGLRWSYETGTLNESKPAPEFLQVLARRVADFCRIPAEAFPHVLVTEYPPGAPMGWHRDAPPFAVIYGVSLASDCTFKLRPHLKHLQSKENTINLTAERRSLYVMAGASRSEWQHGLPPVKQLRYSITLRTLKRYS
jgi:alkylated DNA repair dioxygenase AlkB